MESLRPGARALAADASRAEARRAAQTVWGHVAPGLGPAGAWKLVDGDVVRASQALRSLPGQALAPYRALVQHVAGHGGHAGISAALAARTVVRVHDAPGRLAQRLHGVALARRQLLAWLQAEARPCSRQQAMRAVAGDHGPALLAGWEAMSHGGASVDLDTIDVRCGPVDAPTWSPGLMVTPAAAPVGPGAVAGHVAIVGDLLDAARQAPSLRTSSPQAWAAWQGVAEGRVRALRQALADMDVRLVVCRKGDREVAEALALDGVLVVTDAPLSLARRVAVATGARPVARVQDLPGNLGQATAARVRRRSEWRLQGAGPGQTLEVPGDGPWGQVRVAEAEAWLRAAAPALADLRCLPGAGAWQRGAAKAIRAVADHARGAAPLGMRAVADALDDVADALVRNHGLDPTRHFPPQDVADAFCAVRLAVTAALDMALQTLRIDGTYAKRPSTGAALRGGTGRIGSPRGMPGDVPPLM